MILSYHPCFYGDRFRLCAGRKLDGRDRSLMCRASAVLLPPGRLPELYREAVSCCGVVFPDYSSRYLYPGKPGDIRIFREHGLPHPPTDIFHHTRDCLPGYLESISYPVMIKHSAGGEGRLVYRVHTPEEAAQVLEIFRGMERSGLRGFLVQEIVDAGDKTLRVVVIHDRLYTYWRVQPEAGKVQHNLAQGGFMDFDSDPELQDKGRSLVQKLCAASGINLAGIDVLFDHAGPGEPVPMLLEINFFFGLQGLGGLQGYHKLLKEGVRDWILQRGLRLPPKDFPGSRCGTGSSNLAQSHFKEDS
ncbi:hypothetical protein [Desulfonatronospira sp.]|uniref:ATP-grasp domain-containing protein n=1 Tax=Desulfonatronospira sp. TaxID=1962951 RepID=UPI0025BA0F6E|nr:hypothetical protein [Desulfonatronospira sp.]